MRKIAVIILFSLTLWLSCGTETPSEPIITEPITITSPIQNASVSDTVTITTTVGTDYSFSRVDFYVDDDSLYSDQTSPFNYKWFTGIYRHNSHHVLKAIAYDTTSYESDTVGVTVIIPDGPIAIISPEDGSIVFNPASIVVKKAPAYNFDRVVLLVDSDSVQTDTSASDTITFTLNLSGYPDNSSLSLSIKGIEESIEYFSSSVNVTVILNPILGELEYISTFTTAGPAVRVASEGDYLYIATGSEGLYGVDVSSPQSPAWLFRFDSPGEALGVDVDRPYVFLADGDLGVQRFNNANPNTIIPAGSYNTPLGLSWNIKVSGNTLFVADNDALQIISINGNTLNPLFRLSITGGQVKDVDVFNETAYVLDYYGITVVDVSNPSSPVILSRFGALIGQGQAVSAIDSFVFVGTNAELMKLSSANPSSLHSLYSLSNSGGFTGVFATDSVLYASLGGSNGGAFAFDYRSGNQLLLLSSYSFSEVCNDICATDPFVFLASQANKAHILRFIR